MLAATGFGLENRLDFMCLSAPAAASGLLGERREKEIYRSKGVDIRLPAPANRI